MQIKHGSYEIYCRYNTEWLAQLAGDMPKVRIFNSSTGGRRTKTPNGVFWLHARAHGISRLVFDQEIKKMFSAIVRRCVYPACKSALLTQQPLLGAGVGYSGEIVRRAMSVTTDAKVSVSTPVHTPASLLFVQTVPLFARNELTLPHLLNEYAHARMQTHAAVQVPKKRKGNNPKGTTPAALLATYQFSAELAAVTGTAQDTRQAALKAVWAYIKQHDLQDPAAKRFVLPDGKLKAVLGGQDRVSMYSMLGLLAPHITPL